MNHHATASSPGAEGEPPPSPAIIVSHADDFSTHDDAQSHSASDVYPWSTTDLGGSATSLAPSTLNATGLSVNYVPSKFSEPQGMHRRKTIKKKTEAARKPGGGRGVFAARESRMPVDNLTEDDEGLKWNWCCSRRKRRQVDHWNRFKVVLFFANTLLTLWSTTGIIFCFLTWFNTFNDADVVVVGNRTELILSTIASILGFLCSVVGWAGILLNNRTFLSYYTALLWIVFAFVVAPGYVTFRRKNQNLEGKLDAQWSRYIGAVGRLRIQNQLRCCGFFNPFVEATVSQTCYSRSLLPGCKGRYSRFQKNVLTMWSTISFSLVPVQLFTMIAALLCSNHITYRFGKGMMPKQYRLDPQSMHVIVENYARYMGAQYGQELAEELMRQWQNKSRLGLSELTPELERSALGRSPSSSTLLDTRTPRGHDGFKRT